MRIEDLIKLHEFTVKEINSVPEVTGCYIIFCENNPIYVGKATNLRERLKQHDSPDEENVCIRILKRFFSFTMTDSVAEAEEMEGLIYDTFIENLKFVPAANRIAPPKSKYSNVDNKGEFVRHVKYLTHCLAKKKGGNIHRNNK